VAVPYQPVITREQWRATPDPTYLLAAMYDKRTLFDLSRPVDKRHIGRLALPSDRKLRLFACAGERLIKAVRSTALRLEAVAELGESLADGLITHDSLGEYACYMCNATCAKNAAELVARNVAHKSGLLVAFHDIMGDPFSAEQFVARVGLQANSDVRPLVSFVNWENGLIVKTAQHIYEAKSFGELPVLADMLVDAGQSEGPELLQHLRAPGDHYKGCWALDCLLGKG